MSIDRVFLTGGARSGKSHAAEQIVGDQATATYVATGPHPSSADPEWEARVDRHRARRPARWTTRESTDLPSAIAAATPQRPVLIDCLTLWLTAQLDDLGAWGALDPAGSDAVHRGLAQRIDALVSAIDGCPGGLVVVSNEVGSGIVPADPGTRLFRDWLGVVNTKVAAACDRAFLVVAGLVLPLQPATTVTATDRT